VFVVDGRRRLLQAFMSLEHPLIEKFKHEELKYREIKVLHIILDVPFYSRV
jgi:hypothetical protein